MQELANWHLALSTYQTIPTIGPDSNANTSMSSSLQSSETWIDNKDNVSSAAARGGIFFFFSFIRGFLVFLNLLFKMIKKIRNKIIGSPTYNCSLFRSDIYVVLEMRHLDTENRELALRS